MKSIAMGAFGLAIFAAGTAVAGGDYDLNKIAEHIFVAADANKDGAMSAAEHKAAGLGKYGVDFSDLDLDGDGSVTLAEYRKVFEMHHKPGRSA